MFIQLVCYCYVDHSRNETNNEVGGWYIVDKFKRDWEGKWLLAVLKYDSKSNGKKNGKASEDEGL